MDRKIESILHIVGTRPNIPKIKPIHDALANLELTQEICHTGQHYDSNLFDILYEQLQLPSPNYQFHPGDGSTTSQLSKMMSDLELVVSKTKPDLILVYGDVNSTLAASIVANQLQVKTAHVESGLRSFDRTMPEETNRVIVDQLSDIHFTTSSECEENLRKEGIQSNQVHFVGNPMIDTLLKYGVNGSRQIAEKSSKFGSEYALVTLHRASNTNSFEVLSQIIQQLGNLSNEIPIIFPVHPRFRKKLKEYGVESNERINFLEPQGYFEFINLMVGSSIIITDSGGIQEEALVLGKPCLTVRPNTERPITLVNGANKLIKIDEIFSKAMDAVKFRNDIVFSVPKLWDGNSGLRIANLIAKLK
jgi:UDP-N-acetylglucosamine 2-epimerase (non-hydrolysing)